MKNIVIIGASSGIGKSLAQDLSDKASVYGSYHSKPQASNQIQYFKYDVLNDDLPLGQLPERIDGLVYCPGAIALKPFKRFSEEDFLNDYRLQVVGAAKTIQALLPQLQKSESGSVVLFSTVAVQHGFNFHSLVASSKGAIEGLTRSLAAEFAPKIRFNAVAPSLTDTPLAAQLLSNDKKREMNAARHPLGRIGEAKDIAKAAAYLLSDDSSWMTGQVLKPDGGMSSLKL